MAYVKRLTADLSALKRPSRRSFADLEKAHRDRPGDADAAAELAYAHLSRGAKNQAADLAQKALALRPKHPLATYVAARVRLADGKEDKAAAMLEAALDSRAPEPLSLELLAELKLKAKKYDAAADLYALGERLEPGNSKWTTALAHVYLVAKRPKPLAETLTRLAQMTPTTLRRKELAELALAEKDYTAAARWANQALEIDVNDAEVHRLLARALVGGGKYAAAIEEYEIAVELDPSHTETRFAAGRGLRARTPLGRGPRGAQSAIEA